tara:strand:- start:70 stop:249 length:180 start_codon:yes stop_codon:yes gene_type:complete
MRKNFKGTAYGIYRVTINDGFSVTVNASSANDAVSIVLNSGIVNAPLSAVKSANIVKMI